MGITAVGFSTSSFQASTTPSVTITSSTGGNLLCLLIRMAPPGGTAHCLSVTDNHSNTYTQITGAFATNITAGVSTDIWYCNNVGAGVTTITATLDQAGAVLYGGELTGQATTSPVNVAGSLSTTGAHMGPALVTTNTDTYCVCTLSGNTVGSTGVSAPWSTTTGLNLTSIVLVPQGTTGTFQAAYIPTTSDQFASSAAAFSSVATSTVPAAGLLMMGMGK